MAEEAGFPGAGRAVGNVLARAEGFALVADSDQYRAPPGHEAEQARQLRSEGVVVANGRLSLD